MAITYDSTTSLIDLSVSFRDIDEKVQTVHYLLNTLDANLNAISDGIIGNFLTDLEAATNAQITRVSTILMPHITGQRNGTQDAISTPPDASFPYVKEYAVLTYEAVGEVTTSGKVPYQTLVIPAPNNITFAAGGAIDTLNAHIAAINTFYDAFGTARLGYVAGSQTFASQGMNFRPERSAFAQNAATSIQA